MFVRHPSFHLTTAFCGSIFRLRANSSDLLRAYHRRILSSRLGLRSTSAIKPPPPFILVVVNAGYPRRRRVVFKCLDPVLGELGTQAPPQTKSPYVKSQM